MVYRINTLMEQGLLHKFDMIRVHRYVRYDDNGNY